MSNMGTDTAVMTQAAHKLRTSVVYPPSVADTIADFLEDEAAYHRIFRGSSGPRSTHAYVIACEILRTTAAPMSNLKERHEHEVP